MKWWLNKCFLLLTLIFLLIQVSYGEEIAANTTQSNQNIIIEINSTDNLPVRDATIIVSDNESMYLFTNDNGLASFSAKQNETYTFMINAENYENVTKKVSIVPGILDKKIIFTLKPLTTPIQIEVNSTNNMPVKGATIEISDNGKIAYYRTNDEGIAVFHGEQYKNYSLIIMAESYEDVTTNITVDPRILDNKIKFTLNSQMDSDFWPLFIPAAIGFITLLYWSIRFHNPRFIPYVRLEKLVFYSLLLILTFSWPAVTIYLFIMHKINILLYGVSFSFYIVIAAELGVLFYLLLSIEEIFAQTVPRYKKMSILWGYIRRITIAPYIAILGVYVLLDAAKVQNIWFILLFSFIAGMFTKTIEERLYSAVQGILPEEKLKEFKERKLIYSIENSELVLRLKVDPDDAYKLFEHDIRKVDQLAHIDNKKLNEVKKEIGDRYVDKIINDAKKQTDDIDKLKEFLSLTTSELDLLVNKAKVYSITDFAYLDLDSIDWGMTKPTDNKKITDSFKQKQGKAKSIASSEGM